MTNVKEKQLLIDNFVNAIYLYDDKIVFTFNYKADARTVNLEDINISDIEDFTEPKH